MRPLVLGVTGCGASVVTRRAGSRPVAVGSVVWGLRAGRRARAARRGGSRGVLVHPRDLVLLGWLAEQYAATTEQVGVLLGCGPRSVQRVLSRLREAGLVDTRRVLVGQAAWVMPTRAGLRACGSLYKVWQPKLGVLLHTAAVNDVRLHIQARSPHAEWVSERALGAGPPGGRAPTRRGGHRSTGGASRSRWSSR